jgi:ribonucleoside-diphosphate reductase alpha chain
LAGNLSSGIEPVFSRRQRRRVRLPGNGEETLAAEDPALRLWRQRRGPGGEPPAFVDAHGVAADEHLAMQAAVQPYVDNAVSKTVNVPESVDFREFERLYRRAHELGLKGCTIFRPNPVTGAILARGETEGEGDGCCGAD